MVNPPSQQDPSAAAGPKEIGGFVESGFEAVREAFAAAAPRPGGAAFAAYVDGRMVADLWLGDASPGRPWSHDTTAVMMSAVKGVTALAAHICVDRGLLDLDAPVATYWPEFGTSGKEGMLVRHVLSHTAGITTVPGYLDLLHVDGTGWDEDEEILRRLAAAEPQWVPGTRGTYHAFTYGWLLGEVIRRATGRSVQDVIRDDICRPLGIDIRLGSPAGDPYADRRARVITPPRATKDEPERYAFEQALTSATEPLGQTVFGTGTTNPIYEFNTFMNEGPGIQVPLSGTSGISTARDLARMYQALALGGELDGTRLLSEEAVTRASATEFEGTDELWGIPHRMALGFILSGHMHNHYGRDGSGFGHPGQGGQYAWADPTHKVSFAYVRNYIVLGDDLGPMNALYEALD
ncbi:serine hydrolase domain-containing protein [Nocardioides sp. AX2bis]|uniref:serine hydrolase domain-containing protein n=1 Tax=Nocardioides sp. AX2bis TaxID=2653157 RepID=UPI0012F11C6E|nr:serine hydrolase domain-containing protein [Nocardioides sp. AX2bis]VXC25957.1 CubicO group peptidase, beta-lactamase class C family [Nocardioides sp. AX2bis]